jgi:tetratricopeptide (TPR) repeat protein
MEAFARKFLKPEGQLADTKERMKWYPGVAWKPIALLAIAVSACAGITKAAAPQQSPANLTAASDGPQAWFQRGQTALQAGDLATAADAFHHVLAQDPNAGAAYVNLGVIAMRRKEWDEALRNFNKAERLAPKMTGIRLNIALVKFRQEKYAEAIAPLKSVLQDEPDSDQARYLLGLCELFTNRFAEATQTFESLWEHMSGDVMYLYVLGIAAHQAGDKELDDKALTQLVAVGGDSPELHLILGKAHFQHQEYDPALAEFQKAMATNPQLPLLHFHLGMTYKELDRDAEAEQEFLKDLTIDPGLPDDHYQLGQLYSRQQKDAEAEKEYRETLKRDAQRSGAWFGLAKIYERQEHYGEALKAATEAAKLAPDSRLVHFLRGQILQKLGRTEEARVEFATAKKLMNQGLQEDREKMERLPATDPALKHLPNQD